MAVITLLAGVCSIIFNRLKLPPLIGYLIAGILLANVWHISAEGHEVIEILSDMGMVMLMFCIGLELNLKKLKKTGGLATKVALVQIPLMVLGGYVLGYLLGMNMVQSIALGAIICGSSTATILAVLKSQGTLDKEHIETLILVTIIEDIAQVVMLSMITPMLAGSGMDANDLIVLIVCIVVFMVVSVFLGIRLIPKIIDWVAKNVSSEVLVVFAVGLAFMMALLSVFAGLSMAIGAFLMGVMVASSSFSEEINEKVEPMKNLFMAMFFISIGLEINPGTILDNIALILIIYTVYAALKISSVTLGYWLCNDNCKKGFMSAIGLVAMGEFAFIISKEALDYGVIDNDFYTAIIGAALVSMMVLPILTKYSGRVWDAAYDHCPQPVMSRIDRINGYRDDMYLRVYSTSRKSQATLRRSMTRSYINLLVMVLIEVAFYVSYPPLVTWMVENFGGTAFMWNMVVLVANFFVLSVPTFFLVNNVKYLDELVIMGARRISMREGMKEPSKVYEKFLGINTFIITILIDFVILMVVPNQLGAWEHIVVLLAGGLIIIGMYYRHTRKMEEPSYADDDEYGPI